MDQDYALFVAIVEAGSLSAAGRTLRLSPAMVSKRLARLEDRLGVRLFYRTTRKLALTSAGERFHRDVTAILDAVRAAEERLTGTQREASGVLRVSAPTSFGRLYIAPLVHHFCARWPRVELELDLSDAFVDLLADRIDLAVRIADDLSPGLEGRRLANSPRLLCASPDYLARYGTPTTVAELGQHSLLAAQGQLPWRLVSGTQHRTVTGTSRIRTNSSEIVRELALTGMGIALRSLWDVSAALQDGRLVHLLPEWGASDRLGIHAVYPRGGRRSAAVDAFIDFLADCLAPPPWERADAVSGR